MKIAFITPEAYPFAKTGGLADVSSGLPKALAKAGHDVRIIMPLYSSIDRNKYGLQIAKAPLIINSGTDTKYSAVYESKYLPGVISYFIDYGLYFCRESLYGYCGAYEDNAERFSFFCKAALSCLKDVNFRPDIIHCNDWQTGLTPVYLKTIHENYKFFRNTATVMTVHNAGYQGKFPNDKFEISEIPEPIRTEITNNGETHFLKAGIMHSDIITTVSKKYSMEIQTQKFGFDLSQIFKSLNHRLIGIRNCIDTEIWDPSIDMYLPEKYSVHNMAAKSKSKMEFQAMIGLPVNKDIPMLGSLARLTHQKGMDVLADSLELLMQDEKFQFALLGDGDQSILEKFKKIKKMFPHNTGLMPDFSEESEHLAYAGSDIFIMPSRYEPCGLSLMYALKYGAIPVAHATGGPDELVEDWDEKNKRGNGFKFSGLRKEELYNVMRKIIRKYQDKDDWEFIQKNCMTPDYSWDNAVIEYENVYKAAINNRFKRTKAL